MFTSHIVAQPFAASNFIAPSTSNVVLNYGVGSAMAPATCVFHRGLMAHSKD
ncbi:Hypothetical predicted protein [Olea europaea subsp. europaea]|uniref:Uncharacterized protein n=1 Tax=Olea europaea subsp. europaea TaxID=158383 RepID=A0A8S0R8G2_OLEEU|nr:Hypothetical predicted protein [Olea europaea subsp. europaea]